MENNKKNNNKFYQIINYFFYHPTKLFPSNFTYKYIENYKKSNKFNYLPLLFTNPKWNSDKKKLIFNSFDYEMELARNKPQLKIYNNYINLKLSK